jgi:hypothetical protein
LDNSSSKETAEHIYRVVKRKKEEEDNCLKDLYSLLINFITVYSGLLNIVSVQ